MSGYPRTHIRTALLLAIGLLVVITTLPAKKRNEAVDPGIPIPATVSVPFTGDASVSLATDISPEDSWTELTINPGDNLSVIFKHQGLPAADLQAIVDIGDEVATLRRILPGKTLGLKISDNGDLEGLRYSRNKLETILVEKRDGKFSANNTVKETETIIGFQVAEISKDTSNLYLAGQKAGLSDGILMKMSDIFQWDISFAHDLRQGDTFALLFEEIYADGEKVSDGNILAATFINMGKTYTAVNYRDKQGTEDYYSPEGLPMHKMFIRDPVHFSHVSSRFNMRRLHPVHKRVMPHRGIDYAANRGTPVKASGDGRVTSVKQNSASGKFIVIQHGERYVTKYLHLSRFAKDIRPGKSVSQGQVIGYVGSTGWATGPHLHYEFLVDGVHRNPSTVELPKAKPIPAEDIDHFRSTTSSILFQLAAIQGKSGYALKDAISAQ